MAVKWNLCECSGIKIKCTERVTFHDIFDCADEIYHSKEILLNHRFQLWDFRDTITMDITSREMHILAEQDSKNLHEHPNMVIVALTRNPLIFGLTRMWASYASNRNLNVGVFNNAIKAKEWMEEKHKLILPVELFLS